MIKIQFFTSGNDYRDFYTSKFNYRFDQKGFKTTNHLYERPDYQPHYYFPGSQYWNHATSNAISPEEAKKTPFFGENLTVPVRKVKFKGKRADEDYSWYQASVKKGKPLPKSLKRLTLAFDYTFNAIQGWVNIHKRHSRSSNLPIFSVQIKGMDGKYKTLAVYADVRGGRMFMRYNSTKYGLTSKKKKINWRMWQFVGMGILYRMKHGQFQHCVVLFTTITKNDAEKEKNNPALCLQAPAFYGNLIMSWGTDNPASNHGKLYANYYGYTIAYKLLHNDYYNERNIFLNFEQNDLAHKLQVRNFARNNANNAILMSYTKEGDNTEPYMFTNPKTPQPYWGIWSKPRTKGFKTMGPLEDSYYVTGYLWMEDNFKNYKSVGLEDSWNIDVPIYRLVDRNGKDLIKIDHNLSFSPEDRYLRRNKYSPGDINRYNEHDVKTYKRIVSRIKTYSRIYDPKSGKIPTDVNYDAMYPSYKVY